MILIKMGGFHFYIICYESFSNLILGLHYSCSTSHDYILVLLKASFHIFSIILVNSVFLHICTSHLFLQVIYGSEGFI